jgi:hypothetical protein
MLRDATCYVGCTPPRTGVTVTQGPAPAPVSSPLPVTHSLAFTGFPIEALVIAAVALIVVGAGLLLWRRLAS